MKRIVFFLMFGLFSLLGNAQCSMCRAQLESMEDGTMAEGINDGIVFLMAVPYIIVAIIGFIIYKKFIQARAS